MKAKCIDVPSADGLTVGKEYEIISIEDNMCELYRIIDDNGENKRYACEFFEPISTIQKINFMSQRLTD